MKKLLFSMIVVVACILLVGCGKKETSKDNATNSSNPDVISIEEQNEETTPEELNYEDVPLVTNDSLAQTQETLDDIELYSDDTKFVFKTSDNVTGIFYHDGNIITAYVVRAKFDTHELAEQAKITYEQENHDEDVKSLRVEGKELVIEYGPSEYDYMTFEEVKTAYSMLEVMKQN